jgi:hypothetical protein
MHSWKTDDDTQNVWNDKIHQKIDYLEYKLLSPDEYKLDNEDEFLDNINMNHYFYNDLLNNRETGVGWDTPKMVSNHICMLESQKRAFRMIRIANLKGETFKFVIFIRPDITLHNELPIIEILRNHDKINVPNHSHYSEINDQVAITNYEYAHIYGNRINELADYRKTQGKIVGEKYCKFIINKYNMAVNEIDFKYSITRP